jgi:hypothetical protein
MFGRLNRLTSPGAPAAGFGERSPSDHWARPAGAIWWGFTRGVHGDSAWHQAKLRFAMVSIVTGIRTGISTIYNYIDISYHGIINYGDTLNPEWMGMWMVGSLAPESGSCCSTQNVVFFLGSRMDLLGSGASKNWDETCNMIWHVMKLDCCSHQ